MGLINEYFSDHYFEYPTLEEGIEYIPDEMFKSSRISEIVIPKSVKKIGNKAFYDCQLLSKVVFEGDTIELGASCFEHCISLREIVLPKLQVIPYACFKLCVDLKNVVLPNGLISIENSAFENTALEKIDFPSTLLSIGSKSFKECKLQELDLKNVESLGDECFYRNYFVKLYISSKITNIPSYAFYGSFGLKEVKIYTNDEESSKRKITLQPYSFAQNPGLVIELPKEAYVSINAFYTVIRRSIFYSHNIISTSIVVRTPFNPQVIDVCKENGYRCEII